MKTTVKLILMCIIAGLLLMSGCSERNIGIDIPQVNSINNLESLSAVTTVPLEIATPVAEQDAIIVQRISAQAHSQDIVDTATDDIKTTEPDSSNFYFASFDMVTDNDEFSCLFKSAMEENTEEILTEYYTAASGRILGLKTAIRGVEMRFHDTIDKIDPEDFTDIILTRDGIIVYNKLTYNDGVNQFSWGGREAITDFYFEFEFENNEPGVYGLTGKYKGVDFAVYSKVVESSIDDTPANPNEFAGMSIVGSPIVHEIGFHFDGVQQSFYMSDLTNIALTLDGEMIPFTLRNFIVRYVEIRNYGGVDTGYHLIFEEPPTTSGTYQFSGYYMGEPFIASWEIP